MPEAGPLPPRAAQHPTPWTGKSSRADLICLGAISLSGVYYLALAPLRPLLIAHHTTLLVLLTGSTEGLIAAGAYIDVGRRPLLPILGAALVGLMKFDVLYWWAGRLWGPRVTEFLTGRQASKGRWRRWVDWWQRRLSGVVSRFTPVAVVLAPFLPVPSALFYAAAGWEGMGLGWFLLFDAIGELLWAGVLLWLGALLGERAVRAVEAISTYGLWVSLAIVVLIMARAVWTTARQPRHIPAQGP